MPAIDLHGRACFQRERQVKSQSHPSDIAATPDIKVVIRRQFAA
jgi:hypothetical protein